MTLPLTRDLLAACWDFLRECQPIKSWNLPPAEEVEFKVIPDPHTAGYHKMVGDKHIVGISSGAIGRLHSLTETMAHEMVHAHQRTTTPVMDTKGTHNKAFTRLAARVCKVLGFDPLLF